MNNNYINKDDKSDIIGDEYMIYNEELNEYINNKDNSNIGDIIFISGIVLIVIFILITFIGIVSLVSDDENITLIIGGIIGIFTCAIPICGFGQLISDVHIIKEKFISNNNINTSQNIDINSNKISRERTRQYFKQ